MKKTGERRCPGHGAKRKAALMLGAAVVTLAASVARPTPVMAAEIPAGALGEAISKIQEEDQLLQFIQEKASSTPEKLTVEQGGTSPDYLSGPVIAFTMDAMAGPEPTYIPPDEGETLFEFAGIDPVFHEETQEYGTLLPGETIITEPEAFYAAKMTCLVSAARPLVQEEPETVETTIADTGNHPAENHITRTGGVFYGPSGKETYYNLPMDGVVRIMRRMGYTESQWPYWERDDGAKMLGDYVIVAANLQLRPRGTILPTSMGQAIVCDTGDFAINNPTQLDLALDW